MPEMKDNHVIVLNKNKQTVQFNLKPPETKFSVSMSTVVLEESFGLVL